MILVSLFIPIEIILQGYGGSAQGRDDLSINRIRDLIRAHGGEHRQTLEAAFSQIALPRPPSLATRFSAMAEKANMDGWQQNTEAFSMFNRMRNKLIHQEERDVRMAVRVGEQEAKEMENIAVRYVKWSVFDDNQDTI